MRIAFIDDQRAGEGRGQEAPGGLNRT
jgi:hypothetical protein